MRYPPKSYKDSENAEELRETEKQLIEVAKMVDDDEEEEEEEF
jgi:26S proteasome regulatory subunit N3